MRTLFLHRRLATIAALSLFALSACSSGGSSSTPAVGSTGSSGGSSGGGSSVTSFWAADAQTGTSSSAQPNATYADTQAQSGTITNGTLAVDNPAGVTATFTTDASGNPATFNASDFGAAGLSGSVSLTDAGSSNFTSDPDHNWGNIVNGTTVAVHSLGVAAGLSYSDYGIWSVKPSGNSNPPFVGGYAVGNITPSMPATGSATYTGRAAAVGSIGSTTYNLTGATSLTANFGANTISGGITNINVFAAPATNSTSLGTVNNVNLSGSISGTSFGGTAAAASTAGTFANISGATGTFAGNFYGSPSAPAKEVAGTVQVTGGTDNINLVGAFGAHQ